MGDLKIRFLCDATPECGYGHLNRCLKIVELIQQKEDCECYFKGEFSIRARELIESTKNACIDGNDDNDYDLGIIDTMFDIHDMEFYDLECLEKFSRSCKKSVLISSSLDIPLSLPVNKVIGHTLEYRLGTTYSLKTGLTYAPVVKSNHEYISIQSNITKIFVGFGASPDISPIFKMLKSLSTLPFTGEVDLLLSPLSDIREFSFDTQYSFQLNLHQNVTSVFELMQKADVMFTSYGNMMYEALSLGLPLIVSGTKKFQVQYAQCLALKGLLLAMERMDKIETKDIVNALKEMTFETRQMLSQKARQEVPRDGLNNLVNEVLNTLNE